MSWWQSFCINTAVAFFSSLRYSNAKVRDESRVIAKKILDNIKLAYGDDAEIMSYFK
jgi:hypothetical protein